MLQHSGLSDGFWVEALLTAVHIINVSPSSPLGLQIRKEIWTGMSNTRKKTNKKFASHRVKSQIRVSRLVVLCPCDCNSLKGTSCATTDTIVLHPVKQHLNRSPNVVHPLVVTTRCISVFRQQPQIHASFG